MTAGGGRYLCILFGGTNGVLTVQDLAVDDDGAAIHAAMALCRKRAGAFSYEVWQGSRRVAAYHGRTRQTQAPAKVMQC